MLINKSNVISFEVEIWEDNPHYNHCRELESGNKNVGFVCRRDAIEWEFKNENMTEELVKMSEKGYTISFEAIHKHSICYRVFYTTKTKWL